MSSLRDRDLVGGGDHTFMHAGVFLAFIGNEGHPDTKSLILVVAVAYFYPDVDYMKFAVIVLCNTILFPVAIGIPFTILI